MTELERMLIERACERLIQEYCHLTDHGEAEKVADLFTEDAVWTSASNTMTGRAAIKKGFRVRQNNVARMSRHVCTSSLIDVLDETSARSVCYLTLYRHDGDPARRMSPAAAPEIVGEYRDEFVRTPEGWRFRRREIVVAFMGGAADARPAGS